MRILWISNILISNEIRGTGSWIFALANALGSVEGITLGNIVPSKMGKIVKSDFKSIQQWAIPQIKRNSKTNLSKKEKQYILDIVSVFRPELIHIWGIENGYALITPFVNCPVLIEIQGINSEIAKNYFGGLTLGERLKLIKFKEIVTFSPPSMQKHKMEILVNRENRIFELNKYFTTATNWMQASVMTRNKDAVCFSNGFILRDDFYESKKWQSKGNFIILASASYVAPYKGLHLLLDVLLILKLKFPQIKLNIIGPYIKRGIRTSGYIYYLQRKIAKLGLNDNVIWLGSLNAKEICDQLQQSSVFVNSSFIESAGLTILEAMAIGIPIVSSFSGGVPSFNSGTVLFYQPGDFRMCAYLISRALTDDDMMTSSCKISRKYILKCHSKESVVTRQISIYGSILKEKTYS